MRTVLLAPLALSLSLVLAACASTPADPTAGLDDAQVTRRVAENGDVIEEYRVSGRLQVVKVTPSRGPVYYLRDQDGDGQVDEDEGPVSPVWWKLFEWN
jgi:hypothetical protein